MALWLKLDTGFLDQDSIKLIRAQPEGDTLVVLWIQLMCLAMKRETPSLYVSADLPVTPEMIATLSGIDLPVTKMGLSLFERLGMITVDGGVIHVDEITNTQSLDKLTQKRDFTAARVRKYRSKVRPEHLGPDVTRYAVTGNATEGEGEGEEEGEEEKSIVGQSPDAAPKLLTAEVTRSVIGFLNERASTKYDVEAKGNRAKISALLKHGYTERDLRKVVAIKCIKWAGDEKMGGYLRPSTLFRLSHIDDYIGEYETEAANGQD